MVLIIKWYLQHFYFLIFNTSALTCFLVLITVMYWSSQHTNLSACILHIDLGEWIEVIISLSHWETYAIQCLLLLYEIEAILHLSVAFMPCLLMAQLSCLSPCFILIYGTLLRTIMGVFLHVLLSFQIISKGRFQTHSGASALLWRGITTIPLNHRPPHIF